MTILVESNGLSFYTGNGSTVFFEFTFTLDPDSQVLVFVDGVLDTGDYQVQETGIRFFEAPVVGANIIIARLTDATQLRDWRAFDAFPPEKTEDAMDKLIRLKGENTWRKNMNIWAIQDADSVLIVNDKGTDADLLLWNQFEPEAGMHVAVVSDQIPPDGSPTEDTDSTLYISPQLSTPPPVDEPTATIVDRATLRGQVMTEMNFSSLANIPERSRSHPLGGNLDVRDFTMFVCFRWVNVDPGEIFDSDMFELFAAKRPMTAPEQFYYGWSIQDASSSPSSTISGNTVELGNLLDGSGAGQIGDWLVLLWSIKDINVPDPDRFTCWVVNLTRGIEYEFPETGGSPFIGGSAPNFDNSNAGDLSMRIDTERGTDSRMGFMNNRAGDVTGAFGFSGTMAAHGFHFGQALDFSQPSERAKICTPTALVDHGVGGVNIFGEQASYYSQGDPQLNTGWINTGNPTVFNQAEFAGEGESPPYNYPVTTHPMGDWEYDDMAAADASGDPWLEGDQIFITEGNQVMLYTAVLAVDGHSGLYHANPFFSSNDRYSTAELVDSQPEGSDPSGWAGWTVNSIGVDGVDWAVDVVSGRGRIAKLTSAGQVQLDSQLLAVGDETTFAIIDRLTGVNPNLSDAQSIALGASDGVGVRHCNTLFSQSAANPVTPPFDTWGFQMPGEYENTTLDNTVEQRLWIYTTTKGDCAIWSDIGPMLFSVAFAGLPLAWPLIRIQGGLATDSSASEYQLGRIVIGRLLT